MVVRQTVDASALEADHRLPFDNLMNEDFVLLSWCMLLYTSFKSVSIVLRVCHTSPA